MPTPWLPTCSLPSSVLFMALLAYHGPPMDVGYRSRWDASHVHSWGMRCRVREIETKYYADGENAYCMVKRFKSTEENGRKVNIVV